MIVSTLDISDRIKTLGRFQKASNGFDIRGIVYENDIDHSYLSKDGPLLHKEDVFWFGFGFARWLISNSANKDRAPRSVGIGCDCRQSGPLLMQWFAGGVDAAGLCPYETGICTTPSMFLSCCMESSTISSAIQDGSTYLPFDGAVSITASHLPSKWNGIKFFNSTSPSNIGEDGINGVINLSADPAFSQLVPYPMAPGSRLAVKPFLPIYSEFLKNTVRKLLCNTNNPLSGLRICVNAGNGAGGFLATTLAELGADTSMSIHLEPDGSFPNHIANPEDKAAISATATAVLNSNADLGICLDTDADRTGLVDASGRLLNRNALIALVSRIALREESGGVIVTDSATSNGLTEFIESTLGGRHIRYKKGYRHVIELGRSTAGCVAAVECSGHGAWKDNGWVDDGCYTAVRLVAELAKMRQESKGAVSLLDLLVGFREPADSLELRLRAVSRGDVDMDKLTASAVAVLVELSHHAEGWKVEPVNHEGLRVQFHFDVTDGIESNHFDGWCMVRASLHEPILSLQIEAEQAGGAVEAAKILLDGCSACGGLRALKDLFDLSPLEKLVVASA